MIKKVYYITCDNYNDGLPPFPVDSLEKAWNFVKKNQYYFLMGYRWEYHKDTIRCNRKSLETYLNEQRNCYVVKITKYSHKYGELIKTKYKSFNSLREAVTYELPPHSRCICYEVQRLDNRKLVPLNAVEEILRDRIIEEYNNIYNDLPF